MGMEEYVQARKEALRETHALQSRGEDTALPVLAEILPELNRMPQVPLGLVQISLDQIEGTVTQGRTTAFSRSFAPLLDHSSEFASKWAILYDDIVRDGLNQPVLAMEYYNRFYIIEGNKRVSVMRQLDAVMMEANVTRVLPEPEDSERYRVYQEFLRFYEDTKINFINFDHEGDYPRLYHLLGKTPGEKWVSEDVFDLSSCYYRFAQEYRRQQPEKAALSIGNAFLLYLEVFGFAESVNKSPSQFAGEIRRLLPEFVVAKANKPAVLLNQPAEKKQQNPILSVWHRPPQPLRCAFLYNRTPQGSGWTYWHELGRKALEEIFGNRVETVCRENVSPEDAESVMNEWVKQGIHVIFAASPIFLDACIRQSVAHPETKILNCSLLASYHHVRSYYLRIYEAKFILGAIAGALTENNLVGYIADYPIYGTPASINAFALGAQMTNPDAKIVLDWSTIPDHSPEDYLAAQGVTYISSRDISAPKLETRAFGLYHQQADGQIVNLAMPAWNWSKLYQGVVRSILSGAWSDDEQHNADRAFGYYMGMSGEAIDIVCSKRLPARLRRLVDLLHERVSSGAFLPFVGPIVDQQGTVRVTEDVALLPQEIIRMDYLASNVIGRIPTLSELNEDGRRLAALQGIRAAIEPTNAPEKN